MLNYREGLKRGREMSKKRYTPEKLIGCSGKPR